MKELSNVEIVLLQIINERKEVSGYEINRLIEERGYREWAGIGTTSIYVGLKKLERKKFVQSKIESKKTGKGPAPTKFILTKTGFTELKKQIIQLLSSSRNRYFDLGVAALPILSQKEIIDSLKKRAELLKADGERLETKLKSAGKYIPFFVRALFEHPISVIKEEIKFTNYLIGEVKKHSEREKTK